MRREKMHPVYKLVPMRSWDAVLSRRADHERWRPELATVMIALAIDPDEAADVAELVEKKKLDWPDHSLKAFTRNGRAKDALETVSQWVEHREPSKEEESDPTPRLDSETVAEALADVTVYDQRLGAWCAMSAIRWALSFERFQPSSHALPFAQPVLEEIRNWVITGDLNRRRLAKEAKIVQATERRDIPWSIVTSLIQLSRAGDDSVFAAASSNGNVVQELVTLDRRSGFPFHGASKDIRRAIADACRSFPVLSAQPQEFPRALRNRSVRTNPSDTQALRAMIDDVERDEDISSFFGLTEEEAREHGDVIRHGNKTSWVGRKGSILKINPDFARAVYGNIFDPQKLAAVSDAVSSGSNPTFIVGYADVVLIDASRVEDDQSAYESGELMTDRPFDKRDIGKLYYQIRDGNHRVFGSLIGGETDVWVHLYDNTLQEVNEYRAAKKAKKLAAYKKTHGANQTKRMAMLDAELRKA